MFKLMTHVNPSGQMMVQSPQGSSKKWFENLLLLVVWFEKDEIVRDEAVEGGHV
jgi:hypothetical protein